MTIILAIAPTYANFAAMPKAVAARHTQPDARHLAKAWALPSCCRIPVS
ncbi:MAG: hypothetical protein AAFR73_00780 [Pseudomonadota bacterium]